MFQFEKIDLENILVIVALSVSLIMAIFYSLDNLAMSIVTGLLGYIGGSVTRPSQKGGDRDDKTS
nr:MAG TPA_asm: Malonate/sodium symporter MadM subunit [Caudoviricetes sp.]